MHIEKPFRKKLNRISKKGIFSNFDNSKFNLIGFEDVKEELAIRKSQNARIYEN